MKAIPVILVLLVLGANARAEQKCRPDITVSTPSTSFEIHDDGTVIHKDTGLMWMRCALGQAWDGQGCRGTYREFTWAAAAEEVARFNQQGYAGYKDWRYPLIPELASIVERHCSFPRINANVFPDTPQVAFWSGMERRNMPGEAYALDFGGGAATPYPKDFKGAVRLVRGGPWWTPPAQMR